MSFQQGIFYRGTFGLPIEVEIGVPITGATGIDLTLVKPGGTTRIGTPMDGEIIQRPLPNDAIVDADAGLTQFVPAEGELDLPGFYRFVLGIKWGVTQLLNVDGNFVID